MLPLAAAPNFFTFLGAILFGCAILLAVWILAGSEERPDALHRMLRRIAWHLILAGVAATLFLAGVFPSLVALIVLPAVVHRRRRAQRYALLAGMYVAADRGIPMIPILQAFAAERWGYVARRAKTLATRLEAGQTLPDAVDSVRGLFPGPIRLAIRMGHESGNLVLTLRDASERNDSLDVVEAQITGKLTYFAIVFMFMFSFIMFMIWKVFPAYRWIFGEYGMPLPAITQFVISASSFLNNYFLFVSPFLAAFIVVGVHSALRYMGVVERELPGMAWMRRRVHTAAILDTLEMFARANRPMLDAVAGLSHTYPTRKIRRRLRRALKDMNSGRDWCESLARRRLISEADRGVLEAAQRVGNLPWALAELADSNRRRYLIRANAFINTAFVGAVLTYGALVFVFFVGSFLPLVTLIAKLATD